MSSGEVLDPAQPAQKMAPSTGTAPTSSMVPSILVGDRLTVKNPWVAGALTLLLGPLGMIYSTPTGALVMSVVYVATLLLHYWLLSWAVWPASIFWAVMAARD